MVAVVGCTSYVNYSLISVIFGDSLSSLFIFSLLTEESSGDSGQPAKKLKKSFLGQEVDLSQDELKSIMDAKSSNSGVLAEVKKFPFKHF